MCQAYQDVKDKLILLEKNLVSLKVKFDEALSNDDYDLAAEINEKIEGLACEKYELQNTWPNTLNDKVGF